MKDMNISVNQHVVQSLPLTSSHKEPQLLVHMVSMGTMKAATPDKMLEVAFKIHTFVFAHQGQLFQFQLVQFQQGKEPSQQKTPLTPPDSKGGPHEGPHRESASRYKEPRNTASPQRERFRSPPTSKEPRNTAPPKRERARSAPPRVRPDLPKTEEKSTGERLKDASATFTSLTGNKTSSEYEILGVSPSASSSEIKKAYQKLSRTVHPDKRVKQFSHQVAPRPPVNGTPEQKKAWEEEKAKWEKNELKASKEEAVNGEVFSLLSNAYEKALKNLEK